MSALLAFPLVAAAIYLVLRAPASRARPLWEIVLVLGLAWLATAWLGAWSGLSS